MLYKVAGAGHSVCGGGGFSGVCVRVQWCVR